MFENVSDVNRRYETMYRLYERHRRLVKDPFGMFRSHMMDRRFAPLYTYEMTQAHKAEYPRRRIIKLQNVSPEARNRITEMVYARGDEWFEDRVFSWYRMRRTLKFLAPFVKMVPYELQVVKSASPGTYNSQGYGAYRYALGTLTTDRDLLDKAGFDTEIRDVLWNEVLEEPHKPKDVYEIQLWANARPYQLHALAFGYSKLDWATDCWKRGVNPQVYDPFMSHEMVSKSLVAAGFSG